MKKKIVSLMLATVMTVALCACGANDKGGDSVSANAGTDVSASDENIYLDIDASKYVTLPDYANETYDVTFTVYDENSVEEVVNDSIKGIVEGQGLYDYVPIEGKDTVEQGDVVNIDYCGKKDGVAFDGGTAKAYHLTIGSHQFIDGFEDGLVGAKVGDVVDLNLTFPEQYHSEDLAGKDVVFTVSVNSIDEAKMPEIDDAFVAQYGAMFYGEDITTYDALVEYFRTSMKEACDDRNEGLPGSGIFQSIFDATEVSEVPVEMIDQAERESLDYFDRLAAAYSTTTEDLIAQYGYESFDVFKQENREVVTNDAKTRLVYLALAKDLGIDYKKDIDVKKFVNDNFVSFGYETAEEMLGKFDENALWIYALEDVVNAKLADTVKYNKVEQDLMEAVNSENAGEE